MAVTTVNVTGKVLKPDGQPAEGGRIVVRLSEYGTVDDAGTEQVVARTKYVVIQTDGDVDFDIIPNTEITTPSGTSYYRATFELEDGDRMTVNWQIPSSPSSQDIGDLPVIDVDLSDPPWLVDALPAASESWRGKRLIVKGAEPPSTPTEDKEWVCLKAATDPTSYTWKPGLGGGGGGW